MIPILYASIHVRTAELNSDLILNKIVPSCMLKTLRAVQAGRGGKDFTLGSVQRTSVYLPALWAKVIGLE
jgi:hypothetical protein